MVGGTSRGNLVTWVSVRENCSRLDHNMRLGRLLRLEEDGITSLGESESLIIVGGKSGSITLLDHQLHKIQWIQSFDIPKIISISLRIQDKHFEKLENDLTLSDFIITCEGAQCFYFHCQTGDITPILEGPGNILCFISVFEIILF